ncbi:CaiB/BaiF CoA transferase family protein [Bacilliculturomica massiliensis]|uniref:CaiB/BaiF CoA transferase family protein n=1 Tax=Bacilliculturomica massiliensis TaxID=1917867 RepID=UPI001031F50D|nr:CaiB/BaiF CoA-transferase family protein [Bacilliculturomica massiliensis]
MLESVKILSFTHYLQGPSAVQALADLGADVIKVESLSGAFERHWSGIDSFLNGVSVYFLSVDRNQRSLSIDLKAPEGKQIIRNLAGQADVIVENYRPGVMEKLGFGYEELKKINPSLIYCSCSGFGATGPYSKQPGQDLLAQALSGFTTINGRQSDPPVPVGTAIADQHAAKLAAMGILAALCERKKTGVGKKIDNCLLNAALHLQMEPLLYHLNGVPIYDRSSSGIATRVHQAPYGVYETKDRYICLSMISAGKLAAVFEDDWFLQWEDEDQFDHREDVNQRVADHMRQRESAHWLEKFDELGIWYSLINTYDDVEKDPQVQWNKSITQFDHPTAGKVRVLANPVQYDGRRLELRRLPPGLGEHTQEILRDLGYSQEEIQGLVENMVVKCG